MFCKKKSKDIVVESSDSFSKVFLGLNKYFSEVDNVRLKFNNNRKFKFLKLIFPDFLTPKKYKVSMTLMPDLYSGLAKKNILWIHDMLFFEESNVFGNESKVFKSERKKLANRARKAEYIITPSEYSKNKIIKHLNIDESRIIVQHCQLVIQDYLSVLKNEEFLKQIQIKYDMSKTGKNIIFIGSPHFRKNLLSVVNVFENLKKIFTDINLYVVSYPRSDIPLTLSVYERIKRSAGIKLLTHIPDADLTALLSTCDLLLNPTFEEGFGLPNVEAQICGTPVISSNISCIPEILLDSAILVDPHSESQILEACINVLEKKIDLNGLIERGFKNSRRFTDLSNFSKLESLLHDLNEDPKG